MVLGGREPLLLSGRPQGDVSETVRMFFEGSTSFPPASKSLLTIQEVDASLTRLAQLTKEDEQQTELESISKKWDRLSSDPPLKRVPVITACVPRRCTSNDLKCIIRLVKHDLKMNAGAKHV